MKRQNGGVEARKKPGSLNRRIQWNVAANPLMLIKNKEET